MQNQSHIREKFDDLLTEFQRATAGIIEPDPELGALIRAVYELDGKLPPLRLVAARA